ncbi:MAG: hypothetical protein SGI73_23245 [Chloroflexota bacterium]|nr:hypothetical protein [Chloroflexota bacterium]
MGYGHGWGHHHGGHHHHHHGWGHRGAHFSPFPLIFGLFALFFIFKFGLWMPLLIIGALFWFGARSRWSGRGWDDAKMREWGDKAKREFESWGNDKPKNDRPYTYVQTDDKPKRGDDGFDYV